MTEERHRLTLPDMVLIDRALELQLGEFARELEAVRNSVGNSALTYWNERIAQTRALLKTLSTVHFIDTVTYKSEAE